MGREGLSVALALAVLAAGCASSGPPEEKILSSDAFPEPDKWGDNPCQTTEQKQECREYRQFIVDTLDKTSGPIKRVQMSLNRYDSRRISWAEHMENIDEEETVLDEVSDRVMERTAPKGELWDILKYEMSEAYVGTWNAVVHMHQCKANGDPACEEMNEELDRANKNLGHATSTVQEINEEYGYTS